MSQFTSGDNVLPLYKPEPQIDVSKLPLLRLSSLPKTPLMQTLGHALTLRRDYGSTAEASFVAWLCNRLPVTLIDAAGNIHVDQRFAPNHRTMFTAHTDTVHHGGGTNQVHVDGNFWRAGKGAALGADDGAGIALMCHMIDRQIPGYYLFCRGEERGGIGSAWLAENMPEIFADIDHAVAFDRAGYSDVITHQGNGRCCSDKFAEALAAALTTETDWFLPDNTGVYTDTAEFIELVPECTNISVGYAHQHGDREELNVDFLVKLADTLVLVDWSALPVERNPAEYESRYGGSYASMGSYPGAIDTTSLDGQELDIAEAIDEAQLGDYAWLLDLIADEVCPDDPVSALRHMARSRLTEETLAEMKAMLLDGWTADVVLSEMFDTCYTE